MRVVRGFTTTKRGVDLIGKPRPRNTPMVRHGFWADVDADVFNVLKAMRNTRRLVFNTSKDVKIQFVVVRFRRERTIIHLLLRLLAREGLVFPRLIGHLKRFFRHFSVVIAMEDDGYLIPNIRGLSFYELRLFSSFINVATRAKITRRGVVSLYKRLTTLTLNTGKGALQNFFVPTRAFTNNLRKARTMTLPPNAGRKVTISRLNARPQRGSVEVGNIRPREGLNRFRNREIRIGTMCVTINGRRFSLLRLIGAFFMTSSLSNFLLFAEGVNFYGLVSHFVRRYYTTRNEFAGN